MTLAEWITVFFAFVCYAVATEYQKRSMRLRIQELDNLVVTLQRQPEPEKKDEQEIYLPDGVQELTKHAAVIVKELDQNANSGEWKFHQAYSQLLKAFPKMPKWKCGLAIELAVATKRIGEEV